MSTLKEKIYLHYTCLPDYTDDNKCLKIYKKHLSWDNIFIAISTLLLKPVEEKIIKITLENKILNEFEYIEDDNFKSILVQFMALKLIITDIDKSQGIQTYWILSEYGKNYMVKLLATKKREDIPK